MPSRCRLPQAKNACVRSAHPLRLLGARTAILPGRTEYLAAGLRQKRPLSRCRRRPLPRAMRQHRGSCPATAAHRNGCPPAARGRLGQGAPNRNLRNGYVKRSAAFLPLCRRRTANARRLLVFRPETACRVQRKIQGAQERHRRFLLKTTGRLKGWFQFSYNRQQLY